MGSRTAVHSGRVKAAAFCSISGSRVGGMLCFGPLMASMRLWCGWHSEQHGNHIKLSNAIKSSHRCIRQSQTPTYKSAVSRPHDPTHEPRAAHGSEVYTSDERRPSDQGRLQPGHCKRLAPFTMRKYQQQRKKKPSCSRPEKPQSRFKPSASLKPLPTPLCPRHLAAPMARWTNDRGVVVTTSHARHR